MIKKWLRAIRTVRDQRKPREIYNCTSWSVDGVNTHITLTSEERGHIIMLRNPILVGDVAVGRKYSIVIKEVK